MIFDGEYLLIPIHRPQHWQLMVYIMCCIRTILSFTFYIGSGFCKQIHLPIGFNAWILCRKCESDMVKTVSFSIV